jgi:hypothetical protein
VLGCRHSGQISDLGLAQDPPPSGKGRLERPLPRLDRPVLDEPLDTVPFSQSALSEVGLITPKTRQKRVDFMAWLELDFIHAGDIKPKKLYLSAL